MSLAFGLIHGLGFAAAAADRFQDLAPADLGKLLVGFNLGVETAQVSIILATAALLWAATKAGLETARLRRIMGLLIALAGATVMVTRVWGLLVA